MFGIHPTQVRRCATWFGSTVLVLHLIASTGRAESFGIKFLGDSATTVSSSA